MTRTNPWSALALVAAAVFVTFVLLISVDRLLIVDAEVIDSLADPSTSSSWSQSGSGIVSFESGVLSIENSAKTKSHSVTQNTQVNGSLYRVSFESSVAEVDGGDLHWENANVGVIYYTSEGERINSAVIATMVGDQPMQHFTHDLQLPAATSSITVAIRLSNSSGLFQVQNIKVAELAVSKLYNTVSLVCVALWLVVAAMILWDHGSWRKGWLGIVAVAVLALMMAPTTVMANMLTRIFGDVENFSPAFKGLLDLIGLSALAHVIIFFLVGLLGALVWRKISKLYLSISLVLFAIFTETVQLLTLGRDPSVSDLVLDIMGLSVGLCIVFGLRFLWNMLAADNK